jgi:hypothetical protein
MAISSWARTLGTALAGGLVAGAAQLGIAYGLGILRWDVDLPEDVWHWQLTWLALLASMAVVAGATLGRWQARRAWQPTGLPTRLAVTLSAAVGAAVMIPLTLHPAHGAHLSEPGDPALTAVMTTGAGLVLGVLAAVAALSVPSVAGNVVATVTWLWLAALGSAVWTIGRGGAWGWARPGLLPASGAWIPVVLLAIPALIALAVATVVRFGGGTRLHVAFAGVAGPGLLAAAYVIGAPGGGAQSTAYRCALIGVGVAAAVSVLVAVARRPVGLRERLAAGWPPRVRRRGTQPDEPATGPATGPADAAESTGPAGEPRSGAHRLPAWSEAPDEAWPDESRPDESRADQSRADQSRADEFWPEATGAEPVEAAPIPPADPAPASRPAQPATPPAAETAPRGKTGRRGRRRDRDAAAPPVPADDSDYVDWVRALGGGGTTRTEGQR